MSLDASQLEAQRLAQIAAEEAAKEAAIKAEAEKKKQETEAKFQEYKTRSEQIKTDIQNLPRENIQVGVERRVSTIGVMRQSGGASEGRLEHPVEIFPIYESRLTAEAQAKEKQLTAELATIQQEHRAAQSDSYYKQLSESYSTQKAASQAETRITELEQRETYLRSLPQPYVSKSDTSRRKAAEITAERAHQIEQIQKELQMLRTFQQQPSTSLPSFTPDAYSGLQYSTPAQATGYNPMTGQVELGRGDIRGTTVSVSAAEDKMRLEQIKKEAGYTGKATIDPRSQYFKTVDTGILTPGFKAQPHVDILREFGQPIVTPQRERTKALTGQPDSKYANPNFVSREQMLEKEKAQQESRNYFIGLTEAPQLYTLDFGDGRKIENLTGEQVAEYQKTFALMENVATFQRQEARKETLQSIEDIRKFVRSARELGYGTISIGTDQGPMDLPINKDTTRILAKGEYKGAKITGASVEPMVPAGFTVTGQIGTPVFISDQKPIPVTDKGVFERDPSGLSKFIYESQYAPGQTKTIFEQALNPDQKNVYGPSRQDWRQQLSFAGSQYYSTVGSGIAGILNLVRGGMIYGAEAFGDQKLAVAAKVGVPIQYEQPPTSFDIGFNAPIVAGIESWKTGNATTFLPTLVAEEQKAFRQLGDTQIAAVVGQGAGFFVVSGAPVPGRGILRPIPLRYASLPIYTSKGEVIAQKTLAFGYDRFNRPIIGKYGVYGEGKWFVGKADPAKTGVTQLEGIAGSSFDRFQPTNYTPFQQSLFKPMQKYAEEVGATPRGFAEGVEKTSIQQRNIMPSVPFKYIKTVPSKILAALPGREGINLAGEQKISDAVESLARKASLGDEKAALIKTEYAAARAKELNEQARPTYNIFGAVGKVIRQNLTEASKGSVIYRMLKGGLSREVGDIDLEAKSAEKGERAINQLLKTDVGEGMALERQGSNIAIGQKDYSKPSFAGLELPKDRFYKDEYVLAHGTTKESAKGIMQEGADPFQRPFGEPAFFATTSKRILETFASERVVLGKVLKSDILQYKNIPKSERKAILRQARLEAAKGAKPEWMTYQEAVTAYAKARGYKGVTKPYHSTNPLSPKMEYIIFEKDVFKPTEIIKPMGYGIREGTGEKIINIITEKEQIKNIGNLDTSKVYGKSYPTKKIKYDVPETKEKYATLSMEYQYQAKLASIGGVESRASLQGEGLSDEAIDQIMQGYQYVRGGKGRRFIKDVMDAYLGDRETARVLFQSGDRAGALKAAQAMVAKQQYYGKMFDFGKAFREYRLEADFTQPIKGESLVGAASGSVARASAKTAPRAIISPREETKQEQPVTTLASPRVSARSASVSARVQSMSARASVSTFSIRSASVKSSLSTKSASVRSLSGASAKSPLSAKSPASGSVTSPRSPRTPSPNSPRIASPSSPIIRSPPSPSILSPPSPSILSPPSPIVLSPPSPRIIPPIDILTPKVPPSPPVPPAIPWVKQRTDKQKPRPDPFGADFLGQAKVSDVVGFGKRGEITYGRLRTAALESGDIRESGKKYGSFVRGKSKGLLDATKPKMLKPFKKQKEIKL